MANAKFGKVQPDDDDDDELLGTAGIVPPLVPDGEYLAVFRRAEKGRFERRERWFLWFAISTPGPHLKKEVYLSCPCPENGGSFGMGSNMVAAFTVANGSMPRRRDRMTKKTFKNKLFRLKTRTVTKNRDGVLKPASDHYSVIEKIISVETT